MKLAVEIKRSGIQKDMYYYVVHLHDLEYRSAFTDDGWYREEGYLPLGFTVEDYVRKVDFLILQHRLKHYKPKQPTFVQLSLFDL